MLYHYFLQIKSSSKHDTMWMLLFQGGGGTYGEPQAELNVVHQMK